MKPENEGNKAARNIVNYQSTWCHIPVGLNLHKHAYDNLKPRKIFLVFYVTPRLRYSQGLSTSPYPEPDKSKPQFSTIFKIQFNTILPSMSSSSRCFLPFTFFDQMFAVVSHHAKHRILLSCTRCIMFKWSSFCDSKYIPKQNYCRRKNLTFKGTDKDIIARDFQFTYFQLCGVTSLFFIIPPSFDYYYKFPSEQRVIL